MRETGGEEQSSEQKILPGSGTQVAGDWRGGAFDGVLSSPANQEGLGGDVTVGSLPLELGES
jgi:hypothetical protein